MWRKNLYSNTGYDDNYTDVTFLQQLRTNVNLKTVTFSEAVIAAGRVTEQLCIVAVFSVFFLLLFDNLCSPQTLFLVSGFVTTICYAYYLKSSLTDRYTLLYSHSRTVFLFLLLGFILSPILKTLTDSISTDTIYATTVFMMAVHLVFFDYKVNNAALVSNALSTNAAIFGSLCLASRLQSSQHAFVLLTISVECFVLYPSLILLVRTNLSSLSFIIVFMPTIALLVIFASFQMSILFLLFVLFLNGVCPFLYVRMQRYKSNLYGPWDEAVIKQLSPKHKTI